MKNIFMLFMALIMSLSVMAQQRKITGVVADNKDGAAIIGASVKEKGTQRGTVTDAKGNFTLNVTSANSILEISSLGYKMAEISVGNREFIEVKLMEDAKMLDEVVAIGYGVVRKSDLTGSVSQLDTKELKKVSTGDAVRAMQGRMAGVNVIANSGNPGSGATIRIRGIGTINNSDPLYVVDGMQSGDISHIAPTDIESLEVLKDASATAIYGSRGANGVVLIKTKSGSKKDKAEIQFNTFFGTSQMVKKLELADATQFSRAYRELNSAMSDPDFANSYPQIQFILDSEKNGSYLKGTDWQKEITRTGMAQRYNVNVQGGAENYNYSHGATYSKEKGVIKGSEIQKFMFHSNNTYSLRKNVKLGINMNYVWFTTPSNQNNDYYRGALTGALRSDPISAAWDSHTNFFGQIYYSPSQKNPALSIWENGYANTRDHRFIVNAFLQIDDLFFKGLSFRAQYGKNFIFDEYKHFSPKYFITANQKNDEQTLYQNRTQGDLWNNTNYFSYNNKVDKMNINATLGMELQSRTWTGMFAKGYDVPEDADLQYLSTRKNTEKFDLGGGKGQSRLMSYFMRSNLSWDNKYLFTGTLRYDASSRFIKKNRGDWFPSLSLGWNIANEKFMEPLKNILPVLKLRTGWGLVGNENSVTNDFAYVSSVYGGYYYVFNGTPVTGSVQQQLANEELKWEKAEQYNFGIDYGFFNNKLYGNIDFFIRNTKDMILSAPIPYYVGKQRPVVNAGTMQNRGIEFSINYKNRVGEFNYEANFNTTWIKNRITYLAGDPLLSGSVGRMGNTTKTEVGKEIAAFYGYKTDGIFKNQSDLEAYITKDGVQIVGPGGARPVLGDVRFLDLNGDGKITDDDKTYLGSASPVLTGGFNLNLGYKNIDFTTFMNYSLGNEIINGMYQTLYSTDMMETNISRDMALNHWNSSNPNSNLPRLSKTDSNLNGTSFSDRMVENGSYLRIKQIQLGYTLPSSITTKVKIKTLRLYAAIDNLYTFTKYSGLDPELFGLYGNPLHYGVDMVNYPQPRIYSFGLNITL